MVVRLHGWLPALLWACRRAVLEGAGDAVCQAGEACGAAEAVNPDGYYWPRRGRNATSFSPYSAPFDIAAGPTVVWKNALDEQVRHAPLIDNEMNIYITTAIRIYKIGPNGGSKWVWMSEPYFGKISNSPTIYKGVIYGVSVNPPEIYIFALDMATGQQLWMRHMRREINGDAHSATPLNGTIIFPFRNHPLRSYPGGEDGNNGLFAVSTVDGSFLWEYVIDDIHWNLMPSIVDENTLMLASQCGAVYKIAVGGRLIWRSGRPHPGLWCGCGGGALGPNGLFYAIFHDPHYSPVEPRASGIVAAFRVSNGERVWERSFGPDFMGFQYPAVGRIAPNGRLAVLAPLGGVTGPPNFPGLGEVSSEKWVPVQVKLWWYENMYLKSSWARWLGGAPRKQNGVFALDAETGETIWSTREPTWDHFGAKSDEEDLTRRVTRNSIHPREEVICLPDPQGIPVVTGDGTVYASSSHNGDLWAIRDADGDGQISPTEVSIFSTGKEFLNGPSVAPNMLVAAPCWGDVYIFKGSQ